MVIGRVRNGAAYFSISSLLISGPGINAGTQNDSFTYVWDIMPTILDFADITPPKTFNGNEVEEIRGKSMKTILTGKANEIYSSDTYVGGEMLNGKWMRQGDYKAISVAAPYGSGKWHLYGLKNDPGETENLASEKPELLGELITQWEKYADEVGVILTN